MKLLSSVNVETSENVDINLSPLIDMVFLLLIFFMVTTVFVEETGIKVQKPTASSVSQMEKESILLAIDSDGNIYFAKQKISPNSIRGLVARLTSEKDRPVVLLADKYSDTGTVVKVIDQCRQAGAKNVSIATEQEQE
ncbi:MAG: biopolymer transporter ExbD [Lentisphaeria bacterium]